MLAFLYTGLWVEVGNRIEDKFKRLANFVSLFFMIYEIEIDIQKKLAYISLRQTYAALIFVTLVKAFLIQLSKNEQYAP